MTNSCKKNSIFKYIFVILGICAVCFSVLVPFIGYKRTASAEDDPESYTHYVSISGTMGSSENLVFVVSFVSFSSIAIDTLDDLPEYSLCVSASDFVVYTDVPDTVGSYVSCLDFSFSFALFELYEGPIDTISNSFYQFSIYTYVLTDFVFSNYSTGDYDDGYSDGYDDGVIDGYDNGYNFGFTEGQAFGYSTGYDEGYVIGLDVGHRTGYTEGLSEGYTDGYDLGYNTGYDVGISDEHHFIYDYILALVDMPLDFFGNFLNFDILGSNVLDLFMVIITTLLVVKIVILFI